MRKSVVISFELFTVKFARLVYSKSISPLLCSHHPLEAPL
jgi:hypothetical protein